MEAVVKDPSLNFRKEKQRSGKMRVLMQNAWRPDQSFGVTMIIFTVLGLVFILLGGVLYLQSAGVKSVEQEYSDCKLPANGVFGEYLECKKTITVTEQLDGPIFVYY
jgi:hypothetical protein